MSLNMLYVITPPLLMPLMMLRITFDDFSYLYNMEKLDKLRHCFINLKVISVPPKKAEWFYFLFKGARWLPE